MANYRKSSMTRSAGDDSDNIEDVTEINDNMDLEEDISANISEQKPMSSGSADSYMSGSGLPAMSVQHSPTSSFNTNSEMNNFDIKKKSQSPTPGKNDDHFSNLSAPGENSSVTPPPCELDGPIARKTIRLTISNASSLRHKVTSDMEKIAKLPWRLTTKTETSKRTDGVKFLSVYVDCNPNSCSTLWKCRADVAFVLLNRLDTRRNHQRTFTNLFAFNDSNWGFPSFLKFEDVIEPEKGFIHNNQIVIEAHISVISVNGVRPPPRFDFSRRTEMTDTCIKINTRQFFISKSFLASHSPFFQAMFYGSFNESNQATVELKDVTEDEFQTLLEVLYPSNAEITAENVSYLLELGDRYQINYVTDKCESYLKKTDDVTLINKLVYADKYQLSKLHDKCVQNLKAVADFKEIKQMDEYRQLSDTTKAAFFEKLMRILLAQQTTPQ